MTPAPREGRGGATPSALLTGDAVLAALRWNSSEEFILPDETAAALNQIVGARIADAIETAAQIAMHAGGLAPSQIAGRIRSLAEPCVEVPELVASIRALAIEECAKVCDAIVTEKRRPRFKRNGNGGAYTLADSATGRAVTDTVENVGHMIRALAAQDRAKETG